jgi:hypothetical protein
MGESARLEGYAGSSDGGLHGSCGDVAGESVGHRINYAERDLRALSV